MRWFSERYGHSGIGDSLQIDGLDTGSRGRLWNAMASFIPTNYFSALPKLETYFLAELWDKFFKVPVSGLRAFDNYMEIYNYLLIYFMKAEWHKCYGFIEAIIAYYNDSEKIERFIKICNQVLEDEKCGYRIINNIAVPIIHGEEIIAIEEALSHPFDSVNQHLQASLELLSNRTNPNYPNSVKEAISAVECICRIVLAERNVTLGNALNRLSRGGVPIHGAFRSGISALYGWTSSDAGIRHARVDDSEIGFDEAKMMIVLCSAFVNYLKTKAEETGINLVANYEEIRDS